jgi:hypothetical protein
MIYGSARAVMAGSLFGHAEDRARVKLFQVRRPGRKGGEDVSI